jgi:hypothetical protein
MQAMLDRMDSETQEAISSSAASAKARRGKDVPNFDLQEEIDAKRILIERLQDLYADAVKELEELEKMMVNEQ